MSLPFSQAIAASYPAVRNAMRKPTNQWHESAVLKEFERQGVVKRVDGGPTFEVTLDYRINPGATFLANDQTQTSVAKTDVLTAASYTPAELSVPIVWTKGEEAANSSENAKVKLVASKIQNGINSHDELIEIAAFDVATDGFLGFQTLLPDNGQGQPGGIDAATEVFWRNYFGTYAANGSDIEAAIMTAFKTASKGSGSSLEPTLLFSGVDPHTLYEGSLQQFQRFLSSKEADGGYKVLAFHNARFVYSNRGNSRIYGINPESFQLWMVKGFTRELGDKVEMPNSNTFVRKIYTNLQIVTNNKSRGFVLDEA